MLGRLRATLWAATAAGALLASACTGARHLPGWPWEVAPGASLQPPRWVLIKNPRFGDVPSEPEHVWVEEGKIPWTFRRMLFGTRSVLASPEIVARYGGPPGGGKISPLQGMADRASEKTDSRASTPGTPPAAGYVIFVDSHRVVIDLTAEDGLRPGSLVSIRRDKIPLVHPVSGKFLGELDKEIASAKVVEVRELFSVAEVLSMASGNRVKVKDRVVPVEHGAEFAPASPSAE